MASMDRSTESKGGEPRAATPHHPGPVSREGAQRALHTRPRPEDLERRTDPSQPLSSRDVNISDTQRWTSAALGSALIAAGVARKSIGGAILGLLGGGLLYRGLSGHCSVTAALGRSTAVPRQGILVERSMTIGRPAEELYRFWRQLENLPRFMGHLESVKLIDGVRSRWTAKGPAGFKIEWEAEIVDDVMDELIVWRSLEGSDVENEGAVRFVRAPLDRGTEVHVLLRYSPPAGRVGALIAKLFGDDPETLIAEDLRRFKQVMETGEIPTTAGQPSGRAQEERAP